MDGNKKLYTMTEDQREKLLMASQPVPMIMLQCGPAPSPQENANAAWKELAKELNFVWDSVEPAPGHGTEAFLATPL